MQSKSEGRFAGSCRYDGKCRKENRKEVDGLEVVFADGLHALAEAQSDQVAVD